MAYSFVLVGRPTATLSDTERIYRAQFRVCSDDPCFVLPATFGSSTISELKTTYDLRELCESSTEFDEGAVLQSLTFDDSQPEPELCDLEAIFEVDGQGALADDVNLCSQMCGKVCCSLVTATWRAQVIRGVTKPIELEQLCPEVSINGQLYEVPVIKAQFKGFYEAISDANCCGTGLNLEKTSDLQRQDACYRLEENKCYKPHITNGTPLELAAEESETEIRIRDINTQHGRTNAVRLLEGRINCAPIALAIPCLGLFFEAAAGTLKFEGLFADSERINGRDMWRRETSFLYRPSGWDFYEPNSGLDAAVCEGPWEGTSFLDAAGDCKQGTLIRQDCVDCPTHPGKRSIVDLFGNAIREPIPLSLNGQPLCDVKKFYWLRWQSRCCGDFTNLPLSPFIAVVNYIRLDPTVPAVVPDPPEPCVANGENNGEFRTIYYPVNNTIYTFECSNGAWRLRTQGPGPTPVVVSPNTFPI